MAAPRVPLSNASARTNLSTSPSQPRHKHKISGASAGLPPHHDSIMPAQNRSTIRTAAKEVSHQPSLQAIDSKRASQISNASTMASNYTRRRKTHIGPWELGADIGKGGCGKVRKVRHCVTGQQAAAKIISKRTAEKARAESLASLVENSQRPNAGSLALGANIIPFGIEREVVIMKLLKHNNVVQLFDVWENREELYLIMEYVDGGELFEFIEQREWLEEDECIYLFRQIVAALIHCHRLGIHHRDLKPENILLEQNTLQVKLVDFGMAALQPKGKLLTTPCGSIHYAAPEVFEKSYDGSKVDVWSLGIILYVMLTGQTPFHYDATTMINDVKLWYELIKSGEFELPDFFSIEAKDLIKQMLVPDGKARISLEEVWHHPFIHKYEAEWGEKPEDGDISKWVGAAPTIANWDIHKSSDIDREILRNLRTLWHSEREGVIVRRLLSPEPNQEKYFYAALQKYQEEQLESYLVGGWSLAELSGDVHHTKSVSRPPPAPLPTAKSQFSILNNEHLSRPTTLERTASAASYDPYRASRVMTASGNNGTHHSTSTHRNSRQSLVKSHPGSVRRPVSRLEVLRQEGRRASRTSSSNSLRPSSYAPSHAGSHRSVSRHSVSRHSLANSASRQSLSRPGVVKPTMHKRSVDFSHIRKSSTTSAMTSTQMGPRLISPTKKRTKQESAPDMSSPPARSAPIRSRKEGNRAAQEHQRPLKQQRTNSQIIASQARQVSTELEKFCEQAFFRDSTESSDRASGASNAPYDTPPSSLSNRGSYPAATSRVPMTPSATYAKPRPAAETPNTFVARELLETRRRLADRYANNQEEQTAAYHSVMAHLDTLLQSGDALIPDLRRSDYESRAFEHAPQLPVISEEGRLDLDEAQLMRERSGKGRSRQGVQLYDRSMPDLNNTVRVVIPSSPPQIKPLVIRKNSAERSSSEQTDEELKDEGHTTINHINRKPTPTATLTLATIAEEAISPTTAETNDTSTKKENWFKRRFRSRDVSGASRGRQFADLDDRQAAKATVIRTKVKSDQASALLSPSSANSSQNFSKVLSGKREGFLRFFTKRRQQAGRSTPSMDATKTSNSSLTLSTSNREDSSISRTGHTLDPTELTHPGDLGVSQNWLSRFLNIKPATKILSFSCGRGRARQEIVRLLRSWKAFGIRDVVLDRQRNLVFARLGSKNHLNLREVSFVVEMYVMLAQGQRANLSICRFTQRKGAASSFRRIVEAVETHLTVKDVLVKDREARLEMESVLAGHEI